MDDNSQQASPTVQNQAQVQPVQPQSAPAVSVPPIATPVSAPQKEIVESVLNQASVAPEAPTKEEWVKPSQVEPEIHPEVSAAGVEKVSELPKITQEHKLVGIEHAKESMPVHTTPKGTVQLPMTEKEADKKIKETSNTDSPHWLAVLIKKIFKKINSTK